LGALALPAYGIVYLDANSVIYTIERIEPYLTILNPLWDAVQAGIVTVATSDLTLLEVLVAPLKKGDKGLEADYRALLQRSQGVRLIPISQTVLERAANLRATTSVKTPDAIHAATALVARCDLFVTNDVAFKKVTGLPVTILSEVISPP
jgi:predicted nucleic acid-binding protein